MKTRRDAMKTAVAGAAALPILQAQHHEHASEETPAGQSTYKPHWATPAEMILLAEVCEMIIPRTDTPGAKDARVDEYIEFHATGSEPRKAILRDGLKWFGKLKPEERAPALTKASKQPRTKEGRFFELIKSMTIDGYYSASREGLEQELGWKGNTYLAEFKGCTHPEHQG